MQTFETMIGKTMKKVTGQKEDGVMRFVSEIIIDEIEIEFFNDWDNKGTPCVLIDPFSLCDSAYFVGTDAITKLRDFLNDVLKETV